MTTILINGAHGKMGKIAQAAIANDAQLQCIALCGRGDDLNQALQQHQPDIAIDLTCPASVFANSTTIITNNVKPLIGTSGLTAQQIQELQALCAEKQLGGLIVPNFSVSAVLMMRFATMAAKYFNNVEITELHNTSKKDAPSGTAIHTANSMYACNPKLKLHNKATQKQEGILIHSQRTPQAHAMQEVALHSEFETLSIKSHCFDRQAYMHGINIACHAVSKLTKLEVGLEEIL